LEEEAEKQAEAKREEVKRGDIVEATVKRIAPFGAFVKLPDGRKGLVHISQIDDSYVTRIQHHLKVGDSIKAKVVAISEDGKIDLSIKQAKRRPSGRKKPRQPNKPDKPKRTSGFKFTPFEEEFKKNLDITMKP
jgi:predicted RNA-binding protein with RPS1 domain